MRSVFVGLMALGLASCSTIGIDAGTIANIQNTVVSVCGYLPTASTIINILGQNSPQLQSAQAIAQAICGAVGPSGGRGLLRVNPVVKGVPIQGKFVR